MHTHRSRRPPGPVAAGGDLWDQSHPTIHPWLYRNRGDGARVRVVPRDASGAAIAGLSQLREVNGGDSRGAQSSFTQHVGLGADAASADVAVTWPRAGTLAERTQTYVDVPLDLRVTLFEDPRTPTWVPDAAAAATVPDGRVTEVPCAGRGTPDPLTTATVASGPEWVVPGGWTGGAAGARTVRKGAHEVVVTDPATGISTARGF